MASTSEFGNPSDVEQRTDRSNRWWKLGICGRWPAKRTISEIPSDAASVSSGAVPGRHRQSRPDVWPPARSTDAARSSVAWSLIGSNEATMPTTVVVSPNASSRRQATAGSLDGGMNAASSTKFGSTAMRCAPADHHAPASARRRDCLRGRASKGGTRSRSRCGTRASNGATFARQNDRHPCESRTHHRKEIGVLVVAVDDRHSLLPEESCKPDGLA